MRIALDIPDSLYRQLKAKAASEGRSVKELILRSVESQMQDKPRRPKLVSSPLISSKRPGTLVINNDKIFDLIGFP